MKYGLKLINDLQPTIIAMPSPASSRDMRLTNSFWMDVFPSLSSEKIIRYSAFLKLQMELGTQYSSWHLSSAHYPLLPELPTPALLLRE